MKLKQLINKLFNSVIKALLNSLYDPEFDVRLEEKEEVMK